MWGRSKQATSASVALLMITVGALTDVWTVIRYIYLERHGGSDDSFLWCYGFFFSGLVLLAIGFAVGRIGRSAKQAETAATPAQVVSPAPVAAAPVAAAPVAPAAPVAMNGYAPMPAAPASAAPAVPVGPARPLMPAAPR